MTIRELIVKYINFLACLGGDVNTDDYISSSDFEDICDEMGYNGTAIVRIVDNMYMYCNSKVFNENKESIIDLLIKLAK